MRNSIARKSILALAVAGALFGHDAANAESLPAPSLVNVQDENTWLEISAASFENNLTILCDRVLTNNAGIKGSRES